MTLRSGPFTPAQTPQCASCHKARAALRRPRSGQALCGTCFCAAFEAEVLHTVVAGRLLPPGAVVAVGASGGKDSTVLAPRLGIALQLVAVDEGIGGYRDAALAAVRRQAARWELPLTVVAYADLFGGWTMDTVARSTAGSGRSRSCCTFCGVLRRRALEEGARLVGATQVVTGSGTWYVRVPPAGACSRCGALTSRPLCQTCALLDSLDRGQLRLAIGQGRRGRDEVGPEAGTSQEREQVQPPAREAPSSPL
ncbi:cytoplasmic tRNA 2-thiolation protein 1-like [Myotis yumanensis]|uniref:cytoplasmic tRNA 2-thiolation protein 1-like n=1 Tax=Myotis yumanensis TaxID=159337 RepID=UPI0038D3F5C0